MPVNPFQCEPNQNLLVIYNSSNNVVWNGCVPIGTLTNPVQVVISNTDLSEQNVPVDRDNYLVNGSPGYDIVLPAGHYIAELYIPRTQQQINANRQSVIVEPFVVEKVPVIDYELITEKRNGQWKHVLVFNIKGNIIPGMTFDDGTQQFEITEQDFEIEYDNSGTKVITFTIDEIEITNTFSFQQIPIQLTIELPVLEARLASRVVNDERELLWNIVYHNDEVILDTRDSVGDNLVVEVNGETPETYDFGILKFPIPCVNGVHVINSLRVTAVMDFQNIHSEDTLEALDLTSHNICGVNREENIVYELKIRKEELVEDEQVIYEQGHTEYLNPVFNGGEQKLPGTTSKVWDTRFPFNRIRPCWVRNDGFVERYFKSDDLTKVEDIPAEVQMMEELRHEINKLKNELSQTSNSTEIRLVEKTIVRIQDKLTEIAEEYKPQTITYINDPKDYLKRTDGNIMVEFPNIWHNSFDEGNWIIVQMCYKQPEPARHWFATNVRNGIVHDTIYVGVFYSEPFVRIIDSENYEQYNSNKYQDKYYEPDPEEEGSTDPKTQSYLTGIKGLGDDYDAFSFHNLVLLRLLQIFRFCSTQDFTINTANINTVQRIYNNFQPYDITKKFAGLDYPFGFGIETQVNELDIVRMPAVLNGHYCTSGREIGLFVSGQPTQVYNLFPFSDFDKRDTNMDKVTLYELTDEEPVPRQFGKTREYLSNAGWTKPSDVLLATESSATNGATMPLFVTPVPKTNNTFEASFGHVSTQIPDITYVEESEKDKASPQQAIKHQNYDLLYRAVWWKPNEDYNLVADYKTLLFVPKNGTARCEITTNSTGWKQVIEIAGTSFEQTRINRPFIDANTLRASVAVRLRPGEHPARIALYDTNDILVEERLFTVRVQELLVPVDGTELWVS